MSQPSEGLSLDPARVLNALVQRHRARERTHADEISGLVEEIAQLEAVIATQGQRIAELEAPPQANEGT